MAAISVQGLSKRFGEVLAVDQLDFQIDQGTVAGFLGPNGAGKTHHEEIIGLVAPTPARHIAGRPTGAPTRPAGGAVLERRVPPALGPHHLRSGMRPGSTRAGPTRHSSCPGWRPPAAAGSGASRSACASGSGWPPPCSATPRS